MKGSLSLEAFPNASAVASALDVVLISDLAGDDDTSPGYAVYALGRKGEPAAGLAAFEVTPHFKSVEELERFCAEHRAAFEARADAPEWPDQWFWEQSTDRAAVR